MVQVFDDACTSDNALDNKYAKHIFSGKRLPTSNNTFISQIQATNQNKKILVNVSHTITRLELVFV
jgi:hypothetical protein